jgi:hypothetical protein
VRAEGIYKLQYLKEVIVVRWHQQAHMAKFELLKVQQ